MIAPPVNDHDCLGPTTDQIVAELSAKNPAIVDLAAKFSNTDDLAAWFRTLPQRDDEGDPNELPKVYACHPAQRLQLDSEAPNCYERSGRFIGAAELIDPCRVYRLATVSTTNGLHTYPTRDGEPVILDPAGSRNGVRLGPAVHRYDGDIETRRLRLQRLIGTEENKGARFDLASLRRSKAVGLRTSHDGTPIDLAIYRAERALAYHRAELAKLDAFYPPGTDYEESEGPGPGPYQTFAEFDAAYSLEHPMPDGASPRNGADELALEAPDSVTLTPRQALDWISDLAMVRSDRVIGGTRRIENGHRALCGVLMLRPICVADMRDAVLVLALAEREARTAGLGALKVVHSTARAIDQLDQLAAARTTATPRNSIASALLGGLLNNKSLEPWVGAISRVAGRIATGVGVEAAKVKLASVGVSHPVIAAFEKELNKEGLSLGPLAKPSPMIGSLDAMTPQALAGRWLAQKL